MDADVKKMEGDSCWTAAPDLGVAASKRVILRDGGKTLLVELDYREGRCTYLVRLTQKPGRTIEYSGEWQCSDGSRGQASCRLFPDGEDYFLFGSWSEGGTSYHWWSALSQVEHFEDERP